MKNAILLGSLLTVSTIIKAQQTVNQTINVMSNGVNSTELLLYKQDNINYHSLYSNSTGIGLFNSTSNKTNFFINYADNIGIGTNEPRQKLDVRGSAIINGTLITAIADPNIGGTIQIDNPAKTAPGLANSWKIYNMGGAYGNSLQFWAYDAIGCAGGLCDSRFTLMDNGNVGIGTTTPSERLELQGKIKINNGFSEPNDESGFRLKFYDNGGVHNDPGLGLSGSGDGNEVMWLNAKAGFRFINGTEGDRLNILSNGNVGIGTTSPAEKLSVNGKIRAKEIKVETANWPDYVFDEGYKVGTLEELESYIKTNKRLPEMPSAKELEANGVELGEMNKLLLKKVEELTLMLIEQNKKNEKQEQAIDELRKELEKVKSKK